MLDASAAADVILERGAEGDWVASKLLDAESLHAPHLIDSEIASAFRRLALSGEISVQQGSTALEQFLRLRLVRYPAEPLLPRIWALRGGLTAYDATYISLAESLGAPLLTTDGKLGRARGHRAVVTAFPDG